MEMGEYSEAGEKFRRVYDLYPDEADLLENLLSLRHCAAERLIQAAPQLGRCRR